MIDFNECLEKGLIKKSIPSIEQARAGLSKAAVLLKEAESALEGKNCNSAVMAAYAAIFSAARAVLMRDGYRERSHACVARFLEAKYGKKLPPDSILLLDYYRETRHDVQYEASYLADYESASRMIQFAEAFIPAIESLILA